jgi:hypothetical protein
MPRSRRGRLLLLLILLSAIDATTWLVITGNQRSALYPANADSIVIPLFNTGLASLLVLPFLLVVSWLPATPAFIRAGARGTLWSIGAHVLLLVGYAVAILFALGGYCYWDVPHHHAIAWGYGALLLALAGLGVVELREALKLEARA